MLSKRFLIDTDYTTVHDLAPEAFIVYFNIIKENKPD